MKLRRLTRSVLGPLTAALLSLPANGQSEAPPVDAKRLAAVVLSAGRLAGTSAWPRDYESFSQLHALRSSTSASRAATLSASLDHIDTLEAKILPATTSDKMQMLFSLLVRLRISTWLRELIPNALTDMNDVVLADYLDGELADLKFVVKQRLPYPAYRSARSARFEKRMLMLLQDQTAGEEWLRAGSTRAESMKAFAAQTFILNP